MNFRPIFRSQSFARAFSALLLAAAFGMLPGRARAQLYVGLTNTGSAENVAKYDPDLHVTISGTLVSGLVGTPTGVAVSGNHLFVTNSSNNTVGEYNATTGATINATLITTSSIPRGLLVSGNTLYVSIGNSVLTYDATTGAPLNPNFIVNAVSTAQGMAISGNNLFVASALGNSISEFDATTGALIQSSFVSGLSNPVGLAISGTHLFVANFFDSSIGEYDVATGNAINTQFISGLGMPWGVAVSGNNLFLTDEQNQTIGEYNATSGAVINASLFTSSYVPQGIAVVTVPEPAGATLLTLALPALLGTVRLRRRCSIQ